MSVAFPPRDYQVRLLRDLASAYHECRDRALPPRILAVSRTGTGKTVCAGMFLEGVVRKGRRAAFIVREKALIDQTSKHLGKIGLEHGIVAAGHANPDPTAPIQLCSAPTLTSRGEAPPADVLVFDETETILCETSMAIATAYPRAECLLGLTATPERGDGRPLGDFFKVLVQVHAPFVDLCRIGALVPVQVLRPGGGRPSRDLAEHPLVALRRFAPLGKGRKPVIFAHSRKSAVELAEQAAAFGYRSAEVDGETPDAVRRDALARFQLPEGDRSALDLLTTVKALERGWDCPPADVGILARGFSTWGTWIQVCGRFLRPYPGKRGALIVDLRGSVYEHGLPDDDRTFSLTESETERDAKAAIPSLSSCLGCGCVYHRTGDGRCPRCGQWAPPRSDPRVVRQELLFDTKIATRLEKAVYLVEQYGIAARTGKKPGWALYRYKGKFGHNPKHSAEELEQARAAIRAKKKRRAA